MDLSIIIVNWNSKEFLRKCIDLLQLQIHDIEYEIIVIDSASFDGCDEMLSKSYADVKFIQNEENSGFAKSNNIAFKSSKGEIVLFLNPDTEPNQHAINQLYSAAKNLPNVGAVGCKLLNSDGSVQASCIKLFPTILSELLNVEVLKKRFSNWKLWGSSALFVDTVNPSSVDVISGACLIMNREIFRQAGMFNTNYFMYSEDVELCLNIRNLGLVNYYIPNATVVHHGGGSSSQNTVNTFSSVMMLESRWRYFCKTRSTFYGLLYRVSMFLVSILRVTISLVFFIFTAIASSKSNQWRAALIKWWKNIRWSLGLERWVKKYGA